MPRVRKSVCKRKRSKPKDFINGTILYLKVLSLENRVSVLEQIIRVFENRRRDLSKEFMEKMEEIGVKFEDVESS